MNDLLDDKETYKKTLKWCEDNLFIDARDYISRKSIVNYSKKSNLEVFLSLSITTWMLIINNKINEEEFIILKKESKENVMRFIMFFLLKLNDSKIQKTSKSNN